MVSWVKLVTLMPLLDSSSEWLDGFTYVYEVFAGEAAQASAASNSAGMKSAFNALNGLYPLVGQFIQLDISWVIYLVQVLMHLH